MTRKRAAALRAWRPCGCPQKPCRAPRGASGAQGLSAAARAPAMHAGTSSRAKSAERSREGRFGGVWEPGGPRPARLGQAQAAAPPSALSAPQAQPSRARREPPAIAGPVTGGVRRRPASEASKGPAVPQAHRSPTFPRAHFCAPLTARCSGQSNALTGLRGINPEQPRGPAAPDCRPKRVMLQMGRGKEPDLTGFRRLQVRASAAPRAG